MLNCSKCGGETSVIETRLVRTINGIRRRRRCLNPECSHRMTTHETEVKMPIQTRYTLPQLAKILIREYLLTKQFFDAVETDDDFENLPDNFLGDYRIAEEAFLESAAPTGQTAFLFDYFGQPFALLTDNDFEEVTLHQLTKLEIEDGSRSA